MKLQVTQENLAKALNTVAKVASGRSTLPILANVLIKTVENRLSVAATNLDIAMTQYIGSKVAEEGSITVPARLMQDFVSSLPSGIIELETDENRLNIKAEKYESTINGISAEDFPVMPEITKNNAWKLPSGTLKNGLQQVIIAASNDEARPVLTGVYMHTHNGNLYMVATDSYRLAEKKLLAAKQEVDLLVPANAMQDLLRVISDAEEDVIITHDEQQVSFKVGDTELVTRLIEGQYPDYRKLIPTKFASKAQLKKSELANITKVSSLFARETAGSITINVDSAEKQVNIHSVASQLGENTASATGKVSGDGSITLNSRYLIDALGVLDGDETMFSFNSKLEPALLTDLANKDYLHVIMPLKS